MKIEDILDSLIYQIELSGTQVRKEKMGGSGGGLCRFKTKNLFYFDVDASKTDSTIASAKALDELVDIESIYLRPEVREFINRYSEKRKLLDE